jgi:outer membrane biosynthesis protein TonB
MRSRLLLALAAVLVSGALATGSAAFGQTGAQALEPEPGDVVETVDWLVKPDPAEVLRYYPDRILDRRMSGKVMLNCTINAKGRATACETLSESPWGLGFAEASSRFVVERGLFNPKRINSKAVESQAKVPFSIMSPTMGARYVIFQPLFSQAPTFEEVAAAWPTESDLPEQVVVLRCELRASGDLSDCINAGKAPDPFVAAAKRLKDQFKVRLTAEEAIRYANSDVLVSLRFINPASVEGQAVAVKDPNWVTTINAEKVLAVYPAKAAEAGVRSGRGVADCLVAPDGKLTDCRVAREKPADMGFGASAVAIAQLMQMNTWSLKGRPVVGARIKLPIDFNLSEEVAK